MKILTRVLLNSFAAIGLVHTCRIWGLIDFDRINASPWLGLPLLLLLYYVLIKLAHAAGQYSWRE